jgi:hypothetical protein
VSQQLLYLALAFADRSARGEIGQSPKPFRSVLRQ